VADNECKLCQSDAGTARNYANNATAVGTEWESEPCLYEVAERGVSIEDSKRGNHWCMVADESNAAALNPTERAKRLTKRCKHITKVRAWLECCQNKQRPGSIECEHHEGAIPAATCFRCRHYEASQEKLKIPRG